MPRTTKNSGSVITSHRDLEENRQEDSIRVAGPSTSNDLGYENLNDASVREVMKYLYEIDEFRMKNWRDFVKYFLEKYCENNDLVYDEDKMNYFIGRASLLVLINDDSLAKRNLLMALVSYCLSQEIGEKEFVEGLHSLVHKIEEDIEKLKAFNSNPKVEMVEQSIRKSEKRRQAERSQARFTNNYPSEYEQRTFSITTAREPFKHKGHVVDDDYIMIYRIKEYFDNLPGKSSTFKKIIPTCCSGELSIPDKRQKFFTRLVAFVTGIRQGTKMRCMSNSFLVMLGFFFGYPLMQRVSKCVFNESLVSTENTVSSGASSDLECFSNMSSFFKDNENSIIIFGVALTLFALRIVCTCLHDKSLRKPIKEFYSAAEKVAPLFYEKKGACSKDDAHEATQDEEVVLPPYTGRGVGCTPANTSLKNVLVVSLEEERGIAHAV